MLCASMSTRCSVALVATVCELYALLLLLLLFKTMLTTQPIVFILMRCGCLSASVDVAEPQLPKPSPHQL